MVEPGIRTADGGFIGTGQGFNVTRRSLDGRLSRAEQAHRQFRHLLRTSTVPVEIRTPGV